MVEEKKINKAFAIQIFESMGKWNECGIINWVYPQITCKKWPPNLFKIETLKLLCSSVVTSDFSQNSMSIPRN